MSAQDEVNAYLHEALASDGHRDFKLIVFVHLLGTRAAAVAYSNRHKLAKVPEVQQWLNTLFDSPAYEDLVEKLSRDLGIPTPNP